MVQIKNITFGYDGRTLFEGLSLHVSPQDRLGLVGPNGAGKTTLLMIIGGETGGYDGSVDRRKGINVCRLPQEGIYRSGLTVKESALEAFPRLLGIESELEALDAGLAGARGEERDGLLLRAGELRQEYETCGGFTCRAEAAKVLTGLGFQERDLERDMGEFSGGWQMRAALAKLLLQRPDVLLLDEPTNHLDLPAIIWFESFLRDFPGALVVVSHDRYFLDRTVRRVAELSQRRMELYSGNYSYYEIEKEKRLEILLNRMENQQREIRQTERFIERFRYKNTKARQVQSRIKMLEKMDRIEAPDRDRELKFAFKANRPSGKMVVRLENVSKSYGDNRVLTDVNTTVSRGDRVAIVGANGLGKSTLLRVLAGRTEFEGLRQAGHHVDISYFSQDQYELLSPENTVLAEAGAAAAGGFKGNIRSLLGVFLFSENDVEKKVSVLSGGEKSRLLFARMMAAPANFLLLDEPTNHLDPPSQRMLEDVFNGYDGTICFVSHNRHFINSIATRIIDMTRDGLNEYHGDYTDYELQKKARDVNRTASGFAGGGAPDAAAPDRKSSRRDRAEFVARRANALRPLREALDKTEAEIQHLEERISDLERSLSDPAVYGDAENMKTLPAELKGARKNLESAMECWESLEAELAEKEKEFEYN